MLSAKDLTVDKLKKELKRRGFSAKGSRGTLEKRLDKALQTEQSNTVFRTVEHQTHLDQGLQASDSELSESENEIESSSKSKFDTSQIVDVLRRKEKLIKLDIEFVVNSIKDMLNSSQREVIKMNNRLEKLTLYRSECINIREQIVTSLLENNVEAEARSWAFYLNDLDDIVDLAQAYLSKYKQCEPQLSDITKSNHLKLPKLELPKFYGDVMKFQNFWDQFEAAVHKRDDIPEVQKFTYLRSVLGGVAYQTIEGYEITGANYMHAIETLKHRYGRKRIIITSITKSIVRLPVKLNADATSLRELHDTLKNRVRSLEGLGESPQAYANILIPIFEMKLPPETCEKWELELSDTDDERVDLELFFKFLNRQVVSKEAAKRSGKAGKSGPMGGIKQSPTSGEDIWNKPQEPQISTTSALLNDSNRDPSQKYCSLCKTAGHNSPECSQLKGQTLEERWKRVKAARLCFNCLRLTNSHHYSSVCRQARCGIGNCQERHHWLLHGNSSVSNTHAGYTSTPAAGSTQVLLQTTMAKLCANGHTIPIRVLLDSGSQRSYIVKKIADRVDLRGPVEILKVSTFGGTTSQSKHMKRVNLSLASAVNTESPPVKMEALTVDKICQPLDPVTIDLDANPHLKNLKIADVYPRDSVEVDVLIGADYYHAFVNGECKKGSGRVTLTAVNSALGWIVSGQLNGQSSSVISSMLVSVQPDPVTTCLKRFWELESIGINESEDVLMSSEEKSAVRQFEEGLKFDGVRYEVSLPWKENHPELRNNYQQALRRLEGVERQLSKDPEKAEAYQNVMDQYIERGYAEKVDDTRVDNKVVRFLPHHAIFREDKPSSSRCRVVFDASARDENNDVSLNDCVLAGPVLQSNLVSVLLRFRTHKIALIGDVEKMFLQIKLAEAERTVHRYVWRDRQTNKRPDVYQMTRVTFGVACSPFLAIATVQYHAKKLMHEFPEASRDVLNNMYVDDCLTGADTVKDAIRLQSSLVELMHRASFNLTKWCSNSESVLHEIEEKNRASSTLVDFCEREPMTALGVCWDTIDDSFQFRVQRKMKGSCDIETKRTLLSVASKIFDPMGLLSPYTIRAKMLFQQLWHKGVEWDDLLPDDIHTEWNCWKSELSDLDNIRIPRSIMESGKDGSKLEIHGFGDASPRAYGAAIYTRVTDRQGTVHTHLIMSKSKVAPTKVVTLPRLELLAAIINCRLLKFVTQSLSMSLPIERIVCWSDSEVTLHWIRGSSTQWKTFVANRVVEIQHTFDPECWRHCPGVDNPADLLTRGISSGRLVDSELWWKGPKWLSEPPEYWPSPKQSTDESVAMRVKRESKPTRTLLNVTPEVDPVIDSTKYEKWSKLVRVTAYVFRFMNSLKKKEFHQSELSAEEIENAEFFWYGELQKEVYPDEYAWSKFGKPPPRNSRILKLDPCFDSVKRVLRVGGRLQNSQLSEEMKHPVIIPHSHPLTEKIVFQTHKRLFHAGPETTLAVLREKIWLTQGRREVKRVIARCVLCQRQRVVSSTQKMGPLPKERVSYSPPFTHVGIDFAGPLYVRGNSPQKAEKCYVCIFTCAASRMIHLELTSDMTTDEFLQAFVRMISRRGLCASVWSDNASTFQAADREIEVMYSWENKKVWEQIDQDKFAAELASRGIKWKFITERSPWRGGFWERIVRSVKEPLRKTLGKALLRFTELQTVITQIEAVVNSRPLTTVSDDIRDLSPITPAHLAIGRSLVSLPEVPEEAHATNNSLIQRYMYQQRLVNHFWNRWHREYLHKLSVRNKWTTEQSPIQVGDVVLISEDNVARGRWPMGRIEAVHPGRDGLIRTVTLRTQKGTLNRPVQRLHRLELGSQVDRSSVRYGGESDTPPPTQRRKYRSPKRTKKTSEADAGGEDVRTRVGRLCRAPKKLDL